MAEKSIKNVKRNIKRGDIVMIISGGNKKKNPLKGKIGKVLRFTGEERVIVEGLNLLTKHVKSAKPGAPSGKVKKEGSIHISNVMLYIESLKKTVRVKFSYLPDGKKVRGYTHPETKKFTQV